MKVVTRLGADKLGPRKSGPEQYAPPDRRPRENPRDVDQAAANAFEDELRELVRRDLPLPHQQQSDAEPHQQQSDAEPRQQRSDADPANDPGAENLNKVIGRIASASIEEIDRVIFELQGVRDMLRNESERLSHDIVRFASLNQVSLTAIKAVGESLKKSKGAPEEA